MANKTFIDLDPATPASGDFFPFWDTSAGGARKVDFNDFAGLLAGQGLTANGGKVDLGGDITSYTEINVATAEALYINGEGGSFFGLDSGLLYAYSDSLDAALEAFEVYTSRFSGISFSDGYFEAYVATAIDSSLNGRLELGEDYAIIQAYNTNTDGQSYIEMQGGSVKIFGTNTLILTGFSSIGAPANAPTHKLLVTLNGLAYEIAASPV